MKTRNAASAAAKQAATTPEVPASGTTGRGGVRPSPAALLDWYDRHRRVMPWRALPGQLPDPYQVWLSEIMLQQTTVATVKGYFDAFLARWPRIEDLAAADLDAVLTAWAGLGYYARARNLYRCAQAVVRDHGGRFPSDEAGLLALPGIGPYTAAAIAAIAFDRPATILDGNVERVISRIYRVATPLPKAKEELRALAAGLTPQRRPGDYAQAIMDLGATICTPTKPKCALCPWRPDCAAFAAGDAEDYPRKLPKVARPVRHGMAFWMVNEQGAIGLRRRAEKGLLGGMMEIPSTEWRSEIWSDEAALKPAPLVADWRITPGLVRHVFTHFELRLRLAHAKVTKRAEKALPDIIWVMPDCLDDYALPSVMRKVVALALKSAATSTL
ncbi:MAG TPA: A/G-specific adenine glycosylase [Dongiaceae bacterium]|nr:A/G-specific adenine glycosylase [Dongiaceae bacterium]